MGTTLSANLGMCYPNLPRYPQALFFSSGEASKVSAHVWGWTGPETHRQPVCWSGITFNDVCLDPVNLNVWSVMGPGSWKVKQDSCLYARGESYHLLHLLPHIPPPAYLHDRRHVLSNLMYKFAMWFVDMFSVEPKKMPSILPSRYLIKHKAVSWEATSI